MATKKSAEWPSWKKKKAESKAPPKDAGLQDKAISVKAGSGLGELVETGEVFERHQCSAKVWKGLCLLNQPQAKCPDESDPNVAAALAAIDAL